MAPRLPLRSGFTLVELMVTLAVMVVLLTIALPSFEGLRRRSAIRGAGEHLLSFWNEARFESARRNRLVKVAALQDADGNYCLGAATTDDPADETPCNCLDASAITGACDVARFPGDNRDWNNVLLAGISLGGSSSPTVSQPAVIEPKRTTLLVAADAGSITLQSPPGRLQYRLNLHVDRFGRGKLCESTSAPNHLSDYGARLCAD